MSGRELRGWRTGIQTQRMSLPPRHGPFMERGVLHWDCGGGPPEEAETTEAGNAINGCPGQSPGRF